MNIATLIERLPDSVKVDVVDFTRVKLKDGRAATRVTLDRIASDAEKEALKAAGCIGADCVAWMRSAPEIRHSYFYMPDRAPRKYRYVYDLRCNNLCNGGALVGTYDTLKEARRAQFDAEKTRGCCDIQKRRVNLV